MLMHFVKLLETVWGGRELWRLPHSLLKSPTDISPLRRWPLPAIHCGQSSLISSLLQPPISKCLRDKHPTTSDFLLCPATGVLCLGPLCHCPHHLPPTKLREAQYLVLSPPLKPCYHHLLMALGLAPPGRASTTCGPNSPFFAPEVFSGHLTLQALHMLSFPHPCPSLWDSLLAQMVKNLPVKASVTGANEVAKVPRATHLGPWRQSEVILQCHKVSLCGQEW